MSAYIQDENGLTPAQKALYGARPLTVPSYRPSAVGAAVPTNVPAANATSISPTTSRSVLQQPAVTPAPTAIAPAATDPGWTGADLAKWGYTGNIPINNVEQQAIDFVNNLYGTQGPMATLTPAQNYYESVLRGDYGPEGQKFMQDVINPMKATAMDTLGQNEKALATKFSDIGGYYGGKAGIAQGKLMAQSSKDLQQQIANLMYGQFGQDQTNRGNAAGALTSLGQAQSGMSGDMLNYLLSTGNMITGRDTANRAQYQQALQNAYNDWIRSRSELLGTANDSSLLGTQGIQNIVTTQTSPWASLLQGLGGAVGDITGLAGSTELLKLLNPTKTT
jgi:hypothetical protein